MKKITILPIFAMLACVPAMADMHYYAETANNCNERDMMRQLDSATLRGRAVTTEIRCNAQAAPVQRVNYRAASVAVANPVCNSAAPVARVVGREYFVRETVAVYKPVVKYVQVGSYTNTRPVCKGNICE